MNSRFLVSVLFATAAFIPGASPGQVQEVEPISGFYVRNAELRHGLESSARGFCNHLRDYHTGAAITGLHADRIRGLLDPHYMAEHDLEDGELPIVTAPFRDIHDVRVADDLRTVLCILNTEQGGREVIVLKLDGVEGEEYSRFYFSPVNPPDDQSGFFEPWILKVALD